MQDEIPARPLQVLDEAEPSTPEVSSAPHQRAVEAWFSAWERTGRGKHTTLTGAEGATVKRLVHELGADEVIARIGRAFGDSWFLEHGDLLLFGRQHQRFARPGRLASAAPGTQPSSLAGTEVWARAREQVRLRMNTDEAYSTLILPLLDRMEDGRLVLTAPSEWHAGRLMKDYAQIVQTAAGCEVEIVVETAPQMATGVA